MSNRIRILFHCALEGQTAHVGKHALRALERYVHHSHKQEWISHAKWVELNKPLFEQKRLKLNPNTGKTYYSYLVDSPEKKTNSPTMPVFQNQVERLKWMWSHLPAEIRKQSALFVMRENRKNGWQHSRANPRRYGWKRPSKNPGVGHANQLFDPEYALYAFPDVEKMFSLGFDPPNTSVPEAGIPAPTSAPNQVVVPEQEYDEVAKNVYKKVLKKYQPSEGQQSGKPKNPYIKSPKPPVVAEKPPKPRLRVGVWA